MAGSRWSDGQGPFGGDLIGPNPTDWGKKGVKRSLLTEADGGPLAVVVSGANRHDTKLLSDTLDAIVVERPQPTAEHHYIPHIRRIGEEKPDKRGERRHPARRWVVERTLAWLSKCRALLVRYDKKSQNYLALIKLACALLWYRRYHRLAILR